MADNSQEPQQGSDTPGDQASARAALLQALGVTIDAGLLEQALTHRSYAYEHGGRPTNERLELLGDSVLGFVVASALFDDHRKLPEGKMSAMRNVVVNQRAVAEVARYCGVGECVLLGRGEESSGGRDKDSILADTMEALIGAVHLGCGLEVAAAMVRRLFGALIEQSAELSAVWDWVFLLQSLAAKHRLGSPQYEFTESGPDNAKTFWATVVIKGVPYGPPLEGRPTKKEAKQSIAEATHAMLLLQYERKPAGPADGETGRGPGESH